MAQSFFTYRRSLTALVLLGVLLCAVWWWQGSDDAAPSAARRAGEKLQVAASGYVAYALAREIGGGDVQTVQLVPPGTDPHSFEPTPGAIIAVDKADVFVYVSEQAEPWTGDILRGLSLTRAVEAGPVDADTDPHTWMTPYGALAMARRIAAAFTKADPSHKAQYQARLRAFEKNMETLHTDFVSGLAHCQNRDVIYVGHLAFGALADSYGLRAQPLTGTSHQSEHSVRKLAGLVRQIRRKKVPAIFSEALLPPALAQTLAQEAGVRVLPLYTIEDISKADFDHGVSYETLMRRNLTHLREGLVCAA